MLRLSTLFHAVGEEPTEALIEPRLEPAEAVHEEEQEIEHALRLYVENSATAARSMCVE